MNRLSSQTRKVLYLVGILLLLIPITWLGMPAGSQAAGGGKIAQLRRDLDLGESDLGQMDLTSSAMNFVLLGLRGIAANILWVQLEEQKNTKNWEQMRATTEQIIRLQPHFVKVWEYDGWNLAYNVSAEWDGVPDRYFWVKEGGKFLMNGVGRNVRSPDLAWHVGRTYGHKIGMSDEARYFRRYFRQDPDPRYEPEGLDPDWNDRNEDNYMVAKEWFTRANEKQRTNRQSIMDVSIFRGYPARSQLDYAAALQKYGFHEEFDREVSDRKLPDAEVAAVQDRIRDKLREQTREAWAQGLQDWTQKYGTELFTVDFRGNTVQFRMEMTEDEINDLGKTADEVQLLKTTVDQYQNMNNYRYWRTRALCEAEPETADARWQLFGAQEEYRKQNLDRARELAENAMRLFESVFQKYPTLLDEDTFVEEGLTAVLIWQLVYRLNAEKPPEDFPLKKIWDERQQLVETVQQRFERQFLP